MVMFMNVANVRAKFTAAAKNRKNPGFNMIQNVEQSSHLQLCILELVLIVVVFVEFQRTRYTSEFSVHSNHYQLRTSKKIKISRISETFLIFLNRDERYLR